MDARALFVLAVLGTGCATDGADDDGAGGKGDTGEKCEDPQYGDGTCQVALACGIPDIDCFQTFATDAEAASWISSTQGVATLPETDPLYTRARALTDRAWEAYKKVNHLGDLANARLSVVVVPNININAWVTGNTEATKVAVTVHYHSAILAPELGDEEILSVVFHELAHITKLHVLPEVHEKTQRFYLASGDEPVGAHQADNAQVRDHVARWIDAAAFAGPYTRPELADLPIGGNLGALFGWYLEGAAATCPTQVAEVQGIQNELVASISSADDDIVATAQQRARIVGALDRFATCARTGYAVSIHAMLGGDPEWNNYLSSVIPADQQWLLDEQDGVTALQILAGDRRDQLRATGQTFQRELGASLGAARYYSTEEEADDMSVRVSRSEGFATAGVEALMHRMLENAAPCDDALAKKQVPYGIHLEDTHHGTCWRIAHARQMKATPESTARSAPVVSEVDRHGPWTPTRPSNGKPMY